MATAQYLSELAVSLVERGHEVTVICSRRAYDQPERCFPKSETWRGVRIQRITTTAFGKQAKWRRAADFASFIFFCCLRLIVTRRPDVVVALTTPPLISFIGACFARLRGARFVYWVMDMNPDEAVAAGWLREGSLAARFLHALSRFSFRHAHKIIALDQFMRQRIEAKGIAPEKIVVLPPWSHDDAVRFDPKGRAQFRAAHGLTEKFVVMYSGNHSPVHPLDTLLDAANKSASDPRFVFLFVGGGSEWREIREKADGRGQKSEVRGRRTEDDGQKSAVSGQRSEPEVWKTADRNPQIANDKSEITNPSTLNPQPSTNIKCLPYQPLDQLSASLSAADLHVVVMGNAMVGLVHPCKIYNILGVGAPLLYIGPAPSHVSEILDELASPVCAAVPHGEVDRCVEAIGRLAGANQRGESNGYATLSRKFGQPALLPRLVEELERV